MNFKFCLDCPNRYVGCHSMCEIYKSEKENFKKRKEVIKQNKVTYRPVISINNHTGYRYKEV